MISTHEGNSGASNSTPNQQQITNSLKLHGFLFGFFVLFPEIRHRPRSDQRRRSIVDYSGDTVDPIGGGEAHEEICENGDGKKGEKNLGI